MKRKLRVLMPMVFLLMMAWAVCAQAKTRRITLEVKSGQNITETFNKTCNRSRDTAPEEKLIVTIPAGSYKCDQLRIYGNTTVIIKDVKITHTSKKTMIRICDRYIFDEANGGKGFPGYTGPSNIEIRGSGTGILDGGGYKSAIFRAGHCTNIKLNGITFMNVKNAHHVEIGACKGVVISNCTFKNFTGDFNTHTNYDALSFDCLVANHFDAYNPNDDETPCRNVTVQKCTFDRLARGMGTHDAVANVYHDHMRFINNTFKNITGYAIYAINYKNSVIQGNKISNCGSGIQFNTMDRSHNNFYASKKGTSSRRTSPVKLNSKITGNIITITNGYKYTYYNRHVGIFLAGENVKKAIGDVPVGDWRLSGVTITNNKINIKTKYRAAGIRQEGVIKKGITDKNNSIKVIKGAKEREYKE